MSRLFWPWRTEMRLCWRQIAAAALLLAIPVVAQDASPGYQLRQAQVLVEGRAHWQAWDGAAVARQVDEAGTLRPRFVRREINAALNATEFEVKTSRGTDTRQAGIWRVGAGPAASASVIIDGDDETYWQPLIQTFAADKHWVEIDLGRGVIAKRIVVRFAEDGDPFLMFRVHASDGEQSFGSLRERRFFRVGQQAVPNKVQREFSFEIPQQRPRPEGVDGEAIQFVYLEMLGTDGPRGHQVTELEYQVLPPAERGAIDHYLRSVSGREIRVEPATYDELPAAERGPIRYYRWELPRLAEVEVHAVGDNVVALTQKPEFAVGDFFDDIAKRFITDGLFSSSFFLRLYDPYRSRNQVRIDLGARFWLDRLRLISSRNPPTSYQLRISDGTVDARGEYKWTAFDERLNGEEHQQLEESFALQPVRFIELRRLNLLQGPDQGEVAELQGYGEGYVADVTLTSPLIKLGTRSMFSQLNWVGEAPPSTAIEIRTRTGDELVHVSHYYSKFDLEVTEQGWQELREIDRGPIRTEEFVGPDWSPWSSVYQRAGLFLSPMPRRYTQIQARLRSSEPLRAAALQRLTLDLGSPLVQQAVGEVWPVRGIEAGQWTTYKLYVHLQPGPEDIGVRRLRLRTTSSAPIRLHSLRAGSDEALRFDQGRSLYPGTAQLSTQEDGGLELGFASNEGLVDTRLELTLEAKMFLPGTTFIVELYNDEQSGLTQFVDPGPASTLVSSNSLTVTADLLRPTILDRIRVVPSVLTPNGDGINDLVTVLVTVYQLATAQRIHVAVHDLSGRLLRDLSIERKQPSGEHSVSWDGRDDSGRLVPPGAYIVTVDLDTDRHGILRRVAPVAVAY